MEILKGKNTGKVIGFLCIVCLVLAVSCVYFAFGASRYRSREKVMNEKAISSLCESLDSISVSLQKGVYTGDSEALSKIGNELCRQAASAKENLGTLDFDTELCDEIYKFLSQVGNFTLALSQKGEELSEKNMEQLEELKEYADKLSEAFNEICFDYYNGDVSLGEAAGNLNLKGEELPEDFYVLASDAAQSMTDYPTLIYDGPFSDNLSNRESLFLKDKNEITAKEALQKAAEITGAPQSSFRQETDVDSKIGLYCFSVGDNEITITKKGGYLCSFLSNAYALEETISAQEAVKRGEEYLERLGFENMQSSYYSTFDGICTVNFAYSENGVICYGDLIKVSISLDTGKLVGFDGKNYLLNHRERSLEEPAITKQEASEKLSPLLQVTDSRLAVIPLETGKEALCFEFHCKDSAENEVLVYINALTGKQEELLLLLYSDGGILTK